MTDKKETHSDSVEASTDTPHPSSLAPDIILNKALRVKLEEQLQTLKSAGGSRERDLAIIKLQECIMWLGMDLKRLNEPSYPNSYFSTADRLKL